MKLKSKILISNSSYLLDVIIAEKQKKQTKTHLLQSAERRCIATPK